MGEQFFDFFKPLLEEQHLGETSFTAVDFETTGLYPDTDRIIEAGLVKFDLKNGEIDSFSTMVNPERHIPSESSGISGITDDMVADAPVFGKVLDDIKGFLEGSLVIAHNLGFDYSFLRKEAGLAGREYTLEMGIDTVSLARRALKGHRSYSLQNMAKDLAFPVENAHRALDDARICMKLFKAALDNVDGAEEMTVKELFLFSNTRFK